MATTPTRTRVTTAKLQPGMVVTADQYMAGPNVSRFNPSPRVGPATLRKTVAAVRYITADEVRALTYRVKNAASRRVVEFADGTRSADVPGHQAWTVES